LDELASQLSAIKYDYTNKQQIRLEKKEDMKKRGLSSPDMGDAAAIAWGRLRGNVQFFAMPLPTPATQAGPAAPVAHTPPPMPTPAAMPMTEDERTRLEQEADLAAIRAQRG
jgi:hypothetical protein